MSEERVSYTITVNEERWREWEVGKEEEDMRSMAEYIRSMVEVGRKQFTTTSPFPESDNQSLRRDVEQSLEEDTYTSWEELMEPLADDLEERVEKVLEEMIEADRIDHSPRVGGYRKK